MDTMTLANYRTDVKALAKYEKPIDGDIDKWVNEGLRRLQTVANLEASNTIPLVTDDKDYALPSDLYKPFFVYRQDVSTQDPEELPPLPTWDRTSRGYRIWNSQLIYQPTPTASDNGKTLYLDYYKKVGNTVNGGNLSDPAHIPNIPAEFHDLPFIWACLRAKQQDNSFGEGRNFQAEWDFRYGQFVAARSRTNNPAGRRVRVLRRFR